MNDIINKNKNKDKKKSGFFPLEEIGIKEVCKDTQHHPPNFIHIPFGQGYRHVCPTCGEVTELIAPQITCYKKIKL